MKIRNYAPARWSRRAWIAAFITPLALSLTFTACAPTAPKPTLEDAGKACVRYVMTDRGETAKQANRVCEIFYEDVGEEKFIELWSTP